jgi:hypothetical protein
MSCNLETAGHRQKYLDCIRLMKSYLRPNICGLVSPGTPRSTITTEKINSCIPEELQYSCHFWSSHLEQTGWVESDAEIILHFLNLHFLHWVEVLSLIGKASESISTLETVQRLSMVSYSVSKWRVRLGALTEHRPWGVRFCQSFFKMPSDYYATICQSSIAALCKFTTQS